MKHLKFKAILLEAGWLVPAYVSIDHQGVIQSISKDAPLDPLCLIEDVPFLALPGLSNSHSHAFQFAMAGCAEGTVRGHEQDDFWSWRQLMYDLALKIGPEAMEDIATYLYSQMLCYGYTSVAEFHYIHHDPQGRPYADPAELSRRLLSAAAKAGIDITLVPIDYRTSNIGIDALPEQRRFISKSTDEYYRLLESVRVAVGYYGTAKMGLGVHSLRAASIDEIKDIFTTSFNDLPVHMHISEQLAEVNSCLAAYKMRPVELLFDRMPITQRVNLVHCTHIDSNESKMLAESGANVVICPTTEGNLGDGFFPLVDFLKRDGHFSLGSDSQISLCFRKELQFLDYGQRLLARKRNVSCTEADQESGSRLFWNALRSGQQATRGCRDIPISVGQPLNLILLEENRLAEQGMPGPKFLSYFVFASDHKEIAGTMTRGKIVVMNGRHTNESAFLSKYRTAVNGLR